ncbi:Ephrin-A5 [Amphibalanus amphitrite]|uniref:Ephrin-A5 n=1 Tax=Amphibalanus amphitrite TaxID=1232801 RepID=A0A6A4W1W3_AMPAM|nr:ephrin-A5-like [Amphibalanus amphitrite]KAF0295801.1 Ephrin-A5 [Amphibalanus amphitrite]
MAAHSHRPLMSLLLVTLFDVVFLFGVTSGVKNYVVHWNTTNPIFQISNTDHIIDVNKGNNLFEYDQVTIICPNYDEFTKEEDTEKYIIYNVSKEEYDTCRITDPNPRIIAVCDKPYKLMFFTITFRSFTPQPGGLEFRPGQDYFFISTSARGDMLRRIGGRCSTHNMKVVFKVCCNDTDTNHIDTPALPGPSEESEAPSTTTTTEAWLPPRTSATTTRRPGTRPHFKDLHKDIYGEVLSIDVNTKKSDEYDRKKQHPNDVYAKNEGLTSSAAGRSVRHRDSHTVLLSSIAGLLLLRLVAR